MANLTKSFQMDLDLWGTTYEADIQYEGTVMDPDDVRLISVEIPVGKGAFQNILPDMEHEEWEFTDTLREIMDASYDDLTQRRYEMLHA